MSILCAALLMTGALSSIDAGGQLSPPPGDGEIRVVYWELQNETEVWLTLEAKSVTGKPAPVLNFAHRFAGKYPARPATDFEVTAQVGMLWAPSMEFWLVLDNHDKIDLGAHAFALGRTGEYSTMTGARATIPVQTLKQIANAKRIAGNALRFEFELTESQRRAIGTFLERALSANPAQQPRP
jgi:hypothetical protein